MDANNVVPGTAQCRTEHGTDATNPDNAYAQSRRDAHLCGHLLSLDAHLRLGHTDA
jgi:hypothetical protein